MAGVAGMAGGTGGVAAGSGVGGGTGGDAAGSGGAHQSTPSSGCSVTNVATGTAIDQTMNVPGQSTPREYRLSVPADYVPGEPLPLIFVLNGVGGTGPQAQQFFQVETGHRAIFVYPTSLPNDEAGGSIAWDFSLNGVDVPFFDEMVSLVNESYCVDTSRIFVLGASSGGIMSNKLGCFRGDVFRAIAPSSGMTWQENGCQGDVAVMVICGEQDSFNPCDDAQNGGLSQTNVWAPQNGCNEPPQLTPSPISDICQEFQGCGAETPLLICRHDGGHGWPTSDGDFWWQFFMSLD